MNQPNLTLELIPLAIAAKNLTTVQDDWLSNNAAEIIDAITTSSAEKVADAKAITYACNTLVISMTASGFMLQTAAGKVNLLSGDIIQIGNQVFEVNIHHLAAANQLTKEITHAVSTLPSDDIWSTDEDVRTMSYIPDPFINQPQATPARSALRPAPTSQQDPLGFLYGQQASAPSSSHNLLPAMAVQPSHSLPVSHSMTAPNYFVEQHAMSPADGEANILNDLGIDPTQQTLLQKNYQTTNTDFLQQSPMDRLDEYLGNDDETYYHSRSITDATNATSEKSWLSGVKHAFKTQKTVEGNSK